MRGSWAPTRRAVSRAGIVSAGGPENGNAGEASFSDNAPPMRAVSTVPFDKRPRICRNMRQEEPKRRSGEGCLNGMVCERVERGTGFGNSDGSWKGGGVEIARGSGA